MADRLLVSLQLQMTNNIRDLLAGLVRQLPVNLHGDFLTFLSENGPTPGWGGKLLVGDVVSTGRRFSSILQLQQGLVVTETDLRLTFKPNARSLAGLLTGRGSRLGGG